MKKSIKMLIIGVIILAILGGGYYFAVKWVPENNDEDISTDDITETIFLVNENPDSVSSISFSMKDNSYTLINGDKITIDGYTSKVLSQDLLSSAFENACYVVASHKVESVAQLEEYGLSQKERYITYTYKDNTSKTIIFGNDAYFQGEHYVMIEDTDTVYTVSDSIYQALVQSPTNYRDLGVCSIDSASITQLGIYHNGKAVFDTKTSEEDAVSKGGVSIPVYTMSAPYKNVKMSVDKLTAFIEKLSAIYANDIVDESNTNYATYGLNNPYKLTVTDSNGKHTLLLGFKNENGEVYMMYNNNGVVYAAECSFYDDVVNAKTVDYIDRLIHLVEVSSLSGLDIEHSGGKVSFSIDEENEKYKKDGEPIAKKKFKELYQAVIGVTMADVADRKPSGNQICKITFKFSDGSSKNFTYYEYNERYCSVVGDNGLNCLTLTKNINSIIEKL